MPGHSTILSQGQINSPAAAKEVMPVQEQLQTDTDKEILQSLSVQCKLAIGAPDDPLEKEADTMADTIMRMPEQNFIQRKCSHCEEEEKVQRKPLAAFIQRKESSTATVASDAVTSKINASKGGGSNMDGSTQTFMQSRFGADFSDVNIHTGSEAIQMNRQLNAKAFTVGNDIYFNEGQYSPGSNEGKHLLAHELTHTVQQGGMETTGSSLPKANIIQRVTSLADAKTNIEKAAKGWGTDESMIYSNIRDVSAPDRLTLKNDPAIQAILKEELSGHDLWKAYLLLEYGTESAFPPEIVKIWNATEGWGTDEKAIFNVLQGLDQAQIAIINNVPGLRDILNSELSGTDQSASNDLLSGDYAKAIQLHKDNVAFVVAELNSMKNPASPQLEQNTAYWVDPIAPAKPKNDLFVLTPTHDSLKRAVHHGEDKQTAYFGDNPQFPLDTATYDANIDSERNIHYSEPGVAGEHLDRKIWVHDPKSRGPIRFREVLIHEVQHDADRHNTDEGHDESFKSPGESWNRYKTEFGAYWLDGGRSFLSTASGSAAGVLGFGVWDNARQENIFQHMWGSSDDDVYAVWLRPNYNKNTEVNGRKFQDLVHQYIQPEGVNVTNSPRVDDFFLQLQKCSKSYSDLTKNPLKELEDKTNLLNASDKVAMNNATARRLQEMMKDVLRPAVFEHIAKLLNGGVLPAWATINISEARRSMKEAASGWGTDEAQIYKAIEDATPLERQAMKTDETVQRVFAQELSGEDLWKAQLMLEFGSFKNWPPALKDMWNASAGWGTDEALIRTALEQLSKPQVLAISNILPLKNLLKSELSGEELKTVEQLLAGNYADAIENHRLDMVSINTAIATGLADPVAAVQALFVKLNDPAKALIHGLTRTHNSGERVAKRKAAGKEAFFGMNTSHPIVADRYNSDPNNNTGIRFEIPASVKIEEGINLYILEARNIAQGALVDMLRIFSQGLL